MASQEPARGRGRPGGATLRGMRRSDLPAVMSLERTLFPEDAWSENVMRAELAGQPATRYYLVAETPDAGSPVGYAGLAVAASEADVQTIAVLPGHQGLGIGASLLGALLDEAARRSCGRVFLEVRADNDRARSLYEWFGFTKVGVRPRYYQSAGVDAVVMRLDDPGAQRGLEFRD